MPPGSLPRNPQAAAIGTLPNKKRSRKTLLSEEIESAMSPLNATAVISLIKATETSPITINGSRPTIQSRATTRKGLTTTLIGKEDTEEEAGDRAGADTAVTGIGRDRKITGGGSKIMRTLTKRETISSRQMKQKAHGAGIGEIAMRQTITIIGMIVPTITAATTIKMATTEGTTIGIAPITMTETITIIGPRKKYMWRRTPRRAAPSARSQPTQRKLCLR